EFIEKTLISKKETAKIIQTTRFPDSSSESLPLESFFLDRFPMESEESTPGIESCRKKANVIVIQLNNYTLHLTYRREHLT
ncbi:MAG: hypothetical protein ACYTE0_08535, partial [Planctomycetota bacterium]